MFDGPDASGSLGDILTVNIKHRERTGGGDDERCRSQEAVRGWTVRPQHLVRHQARAGPGPEYVFGTGLQSGTDYFLSRARNWRAVGEPSSCSHDATFDWAGDKVVLSVARRCLGRPAQIRVAERMRDDFDASHPIIDWMKGTRQFSRWVDHA